VLVRLAKSEAAAAGDLDTALRELAEAAAETLQVERASVWLFDEARTRIDCVELYEKGPRRHSRGATLAAADFPAYFRGLEEERAIMAHDAHRDPTTREFSASYLTPLGIGAMLDAPVRVHGRMAGVVCHEHVGGPRRWSPEEQGFAASVADLAAFALEAVESRRAREESEARFRQLAENINAVFFMTEGTAETGPIRLLYVSPAYERIWGRSCAELYARPRAWMEATHPDDLERVRARIQGARFGQFDEEFRIVRPGGEVRWVHSRMFPVFDARGVHYRNAGLAEDVTERKRGEEELRQARDAAEAASRAKDQFLATLSHELRTPLTPVLALASALQEDEGLPDRARQALALIQRNVELEARLIDDLLDLTRISRGKLELRREVVDVRQLLAHAIEVCCGVELASGGIRLGLDLGAREHRVWADAPRLTQVLWNLLNNAVKFTPQAGEIGEIGEILVRSWEEDDGGILAVEVADNGIGIDPELLPRIFNAFEQTDRQITRRFGGLGLGLSLSRAIIAMHGGTLTAASAGLDQGSAFTLRLPAGDVPASAPEPTLERPAEAKAAAPLRLLLVEDHADTAEAMADLLRALGHEVTVAGSVGAALGAAEAQGGRFDLVVSDLGLPDGSGLDVMRELSGRYGLKGIALSGYGMEEDVQRSREAGFSKHLTKPVDMQALKAAILAAAGE
jgi:two-component system, chemotaxis family, CheB/CheR fusion protein